MEPGGIVEKVMKSLKHVAAPNTITREKLEGDFDLIMAPFFKCCPNTKRKCIVVKLKALGIGMLKVNTDASVLNGIAAGGGIIQDHWGKFIAAFYKEFGEMQVLEAEAWVLILSLELCVQMGISGIQAEVDSRLLYKLVVTNGSARWPLCNVIRRI